METMERLTYNYPAKLHNPLVREKPTRWLLMRSRWPIPVVALAVLFCSSHLGSAYSGQIRVSEREQTILRIQQLIQEHDLEKAHLELTEAAKQDRKSTRLNSSHSQISYAV